MEESEETKEKEESQQSGEYIYITIQSKKGCNIAINTRVMGKINPELLAEANAQALAAGQMTEVKAPTFVQNAELAKKMKAFKLRSTSEL